MQCTLHEFSFSRSCRVGCSSDTPTHCVHIRQASSLDKAKMSKIVATFRVARVTLQTPKLWLVGVATDRGARHL